MRRYDLGRRLGILGWIKGKDGNWRSKRYPWYLKLRWFSVELWKQMPDEEPVYIGKARYRNIKIKRNPAKRTVGWVLGKFKSLDDKEHSCYIWHQKKTR